MLPSVYWLCKLILERVPGAKPLVNIGLLVYMGRSENQVSPTALFHASYKKLVTSLIAARAHNMAKNVKK